VSNSCPVDVRFVRERRATCVRKEALSVAEMARAVGLCRARFYELLGTAFPFPVYDVATKRPFYTPELQEICMDVRRRNRGIDGKPILFRRRAREVAPSLSILRPARWNRRW
jgi:hypothetical protein